MELAWDFMQKFFFYKPTAAFQYTSHMMLTTVYYWYPPFRLDLLMFPIHITCEHLVY